MIKLLLLNDLSRYKYHLIYYTVIATAILVFVKAVIHLQTGNIVFLLSFAYSLFINIDLELKDKKLLDIYLSTPISLFDVLAAKTLYKSMAFSVIYILLSVINFVLTRTVNFEYFILGILVAVISIDKNQRFGIIIAVLFITLLQIYRDRFLLLTVLALGSIIVLSVLFFRKADKEMYMTKSSYKY